MRCARPDVAIALAAAAAPELDALLAVGNQTVESSCLNPFETPVSKMVADRIIRMANGRIIEDRRP
ncbi:hypothetical protein SAMN07250955_11749 [Arboricoccus pini]|uniref:Uncharacterized protein n=2 Tax=Arboricoccus pini TaxID=1963835 RepID=A0A212RYZ3_9PROT|nr:hypothetical protein SAMN07250955_11749 [Arboricoccus pini]